MKTIKLYALILAVGFTVTISYSDSSKQTFSLNSVRALAQDIDVEEISAEEAARQLGGSWIDSDGRIHTIYLDHNGGANNDDSWDNFWDNDFEPQQYQSVIKVSGKAAVVYSSSVGLMVSEDALELKKSTEIEGESESSIEYTGKYGVACPSGTTHCEAISPA